MDQTISEWDAQFNSWCCYDWLSRNAHHFLCATGCKDRVILTSIRNHKLALQGGSDILQSNAQICCNSRVPSFSFSPLPGNKETNTKNGHLLWWEATEFQCFSFLVFLLPQLSQVYWISFFLYFHQLLFPHLESFFPLNIF